MNCNDRLKLDIYVIDDIECYLSRLHFNKIRTVYVQQVISNPSYEQQHFRTLACRKRAHCEMNIE